MDKIIEKWDEILQTVKTEHELSDVSFDTWLKPLKIYSVQNNKVYILVSEDQQVALGYISKKYYLPLKVVITELTGIDYELEFILPEQTSSIPSNNASIKKETTANKAAVSLNAEK